MPVFNRLHDDVNEHLENLRERRADWVHKKTVEPWDATYKTPEVKHTALQFAWLNQILLDHRLTKNAIRVAGHLCMHLNSKTNEAKPSHEWLGVLMGVTETWVGKGMRELERYGHVNVERNIGSVNHYTLEWIDLEPAESGGTAYSSATSSSTEEHAVPPTPEHAVPIAEEHAVPIAEEQYVPPNTSNLTPLANTKDLNTSGVSHEEEEDRDDVKPDRPAEEPDEREVETRQDQPDDASASCASAPSCSARSFTGWDDRPTDRPSPDLPDEPPSAEIPMAFVSVDPDVLARRNAFITNLQRAPRPAGREKTGAEPGVVVSSEKSVVEVELESGLNLVE